MRSIRNFIGQKYIEYTNRDIFNIADAVLKTMCETNIILSSYDKIKLFNKISFDNQKKRTCDLYLTLLNCSNYERNLFIKTFK